MRTFIINYKKSIKCIRDVLRRIKINNGYVLFYSSKFVYRYISFIRIIYIISYVLLFIILIYNQIYIYNKYRIIIKSKYFNSILNVLSILHFLPLTENIYAVSPKVIYIYIFSPNIKYIHLLSLSFNIYSLYPL